ncbi:hypothetical protein O181_043163 [Austropuccinia psidii MF-1]|uniref:Uncharacterized protein n=1 Tax=Austropuccinia psidii MF-1 TaxID=1389203 RepID=A0A9Q3DKS8_9BASI|nr:hypothetical protein [Austropuccinia psidii MF-1]
MLVMLANKHTRNTHSLSNPSDHTARGVPTQDTLAKTPLWLTLMKVFPSGNECRDPKKVDRNTSGQLALSTPPPRPPSNGHFTLQLEKSDYLANEGWQWQEDIQAWADCHYGIQMPN